MTPARKWPEPKGWPRRIGVMHLDEDHNRIPDPGPPPGRPPRDRAKTKAQRAARRKNRR
jgi:hypothetical protein